MNQALSSICVTEKVTDFHCYGDLDSAKGNIKI